MLLAPTTGLGWLLLAVEVTIKAALALYKGVLALSVRIDTSIVVASLPLHVAEERSFPRGIIEGRGATTNFRVIL